MSKIKDTIREDIYLCKFIADRIIENNMSKEIQTKYNNGEFGDFYVVITSKETGTDIDWIMINCNDIYICIHKNGKGKYDRNIMNYYLCSNGFCVGELIRTNNFEEFIKEFEEMSEKELKKEFS